MSYLGQLIDANHTKRSQARKLLFFPLLLCFLLYTACFLFFFKEIAVSTILIAMLLVFAVSIVFGKWSGLFSGFLFAFVQVICMFILRWISSPVSSANLLTATDISPFIALASLPASGFLIGFYAEKFGIYNNITERMLIEQKETIQKLKSQVDKYEQEWHRMTQAKVCPYAWDPLVKGNPLSEQLIYLIIESTSRKNQYVLPQKRYAVNQTPVQIKPDQILFDMLIENSPDLLAILDPSGNILICHDKKMAIYGIPISQNLENISFFQILTPESAEKASRNLSSLLSTEYNPQEKYEIQSSGGKFEHILISPEVTLTYSENLFVILARVSSSYVHSTLEQTDQDIAYPANLDELMQTNICCVSSNNLITYMSPAICELIGETAANIIGQSLGKYIHCRSGSQFSKFMDAFMTGQPAASELEMNSRSQNKLALRFVAFPAFSDSKKYLGATFLLEDITNTKKIESILQHRLKIEQLISSISTRFVSVKVEEMDREIENVLKIVSEFENTKDCTIEILPTDGFPKHVKYSYINEQHPGQRQFAGNQSIIVNNEIIAIPIIIGSETVGYFKFIQEKYRENWFDSDSKLICLVGEIIINALIRKENELNIKLNESRLKTTLHSIGDAVIATDPEGQVILMNRMAENLTGWNWEKAHNQPLNVVFNPAENQPDDSMKNNEMNDIHPLSETDDSLILTHQDGQQMFISLNRSRIEDHRGNFYGEVTVFRDVTKTKYENDEIRYISYHDKLTGLYNRTFFEEEIARLNTERQYPITIFLADCNGLKIANDIFGHLEGDKLLQTIAQIIKVSIRHEDIAARWGGDEFAIILPQTDEQVAAEIRDRILQCCAGSDHTPIQPSLAIGSATTTEFDHDLVELIKKAEDRMYRHKLMEAKSNRNALLSSIEKMVNEKNLETEEHASRMKEISVQIGRAVGLTEYEQEELSILSALHDIGKIGIPDSILLKSTKLSDSEWEIMKKHSEKGYNLAKATPELVKIAESILHHHEHWDGTGYPSGQKGEEIPKLSRILTIIDAYDVITHARTYKKPRSSEEALKEIEKCAGTQFDPELAKIFIRIMREKG